MTTYYVQRTVTAIIEVEGETPEDAEEEARSNGQWHRSIDTEIEYIVLDASGKPCY